MKIVCLGDSLTEGDYGVFGSTGIANVHSENYPKFLADSLKAEVVNYGKCGFTSTHYLRFYKEGNVSVEGADIIIIMLGSNGGLSPYEVTQGDRDYEELIQLCRNDAPAAKIALCTPPHVTENPEYSNCGYADRVSDAVLFVRKLVQKENLPLIDLAECKYFTAETEAVMQPNDGLHFGETGYKKMAEFIEGELKKLFADMF